MKESIFLTDGYKLDHRRQYPEGTEYVYSNWRNEYERSDLLYILDIGMRWLVHMGWV